MKRIKGVLTACCVCIVCLLLLTACSAKLSAPTSFRLDEHTLTLQWNKVKEATGYIVEIGDLKVTTRENSYSLENLKPGEYVIKIRAMDHNEEFEESDYAEYNFTREKESGLKYQLVGNAYTLVGIGTASGDVVMEDYYRGKPVTTISKAALRRRGEITSFVVGKNVTKIEENAFFACSELKSVTLPEGLTTIGSGAFQSCTKLESIVLPDSVKTIQDYTFSMCKSLSDVTLGIGLETIGGYAFSDCSALQTIDIPASTLTIGEYAFSGCTLMDNVKMGSNVQSIEQYAFFSCTNLKSVELNDKLERIGQGAFSESGLTAVALPDSVVMIDNGVFDGCRSLATVSLGAGLQYIGHDAFRNTTLMNACIKDVLVCDNWVLGARNKELETYVVPENVIGIANSAFINCKALQSVQLNNVQYIGDYAFYQCEVLWEVIATDALLEIGKWSFGYCYLLRTIDVGNSLQYIRDNAFFNCSRLEDAEIELPKSLLEIGSNAFKYTRIYDISTTPVVYVDDWVVGVLEKAELKNTFLNTGTRGIANYAFYKVIVLDGLIGLPDSVEIIGHAAFYNNPYLVDINLPANLKHIGDHAFMNSKNVVFGENGGTVIPVGCEYIGSNAFRNCTNIIGLYIPGTVKHVGDYAFKGCSNLGCYVFPSGEMVTGVLILDEGIESLGNQVFHGCAGLQSVTLPNSLKQMGNRVFYKCTGLQQVTFGTGLQEIPMYSFYDCAALQEVQIPGNIRTVGKYAFRGCLSMTKVALDEGVEQVEDYAFIRCENVKYLSIADSVTHIGNFAFRGMTDLQSICLGSELNYVGKLAFYGSKDATIYYEGTQIPEGWEKRWNATYIPVVMGAVLSEDNGYILSWTAAESNLLNLTSHNSLATPARSGYTFAGWSTSQDSESVAYADLSEVPVGTTVYSVWTEGVEEEIPQLPEDPKGDDVTAD